MKTIENGAYKIEYRLPSIIEAMRMLGNSGINLTDPKEVEKSEAYLKVEAFVDFNWPDEKKED